MARRLLARHFFRLPARHPVPASSPMARAVLRCGGTRFFAYDRSHYDLFGKRRPGDEEFRKAWQENVDEGDCLWTGSEDGDDEENDTKLEREIKKVKRQAKKNACVSLHYSQTEAVQD